MKLLGSLCCAHCEVADQATRVGDRWNSVTVGEFYLVFMLGFI